MKITLFVLCQIVISSCIPRDDCPRYFEIPIKVLPLQEKYKVGDTVTFVSSFSKDLPAFIDFNQNLGDLHDMTGYKWKPVSFLYRIDTIEPESTLSKYFDFIKNPQYDFNLFHYSDGSTSLVGEYDFQADSFRLIYQLVASHPGTFLIEFGSRVVASGLQQQDFPGKCRGVDIDVQAKMNTGLGNNVHFLKESPDPHWNSWAWGDTIRFFHQQGSYCFKISP